MSYFSDLWAVLQGDGIALDETEAAILGAPNGETISLWAALAKRHGSVLGHLACAIFSVLIQHHHCRDQLIGVPMKPLNYVRAVVLLLLPVVLFVALTSWIM